MNFSSDSDEITDLEYYWQSINMDDIATPGSFWLNPPLPKDDEGNGVNVLSIIESYRMVEGQQQELSLSTAEENIGFDFDADEDDSHLQAILKDIDPL